MCIDRWRSVCLLLLIACSSWSCHDPGKYTLVDSNSGTDGTAADSVVAVSASPPKVPADGLSSTTITARIDPRSTVREVTFATSLGTLRSGSRSSATEGGKLTLAADVAGSASVELK